MAADDCLNLMIRDEWELLAACKDMDTNAFYVDPLDPNREEKEAIAKRVCANCPVGDECLEKARSRHEEYGIWNGVNVEDPEFSW